MSALRYRYNNVCAVVASHQPGGVVELKAKGGGIIRVSWFGWICERGITFIEGHRGKLIATDVTDGDGLTGTWQALGHDQYILAHVVHYRTGNNLFGAYGVVNKKGSPIVLSENDRPLRLIRA